MLQTLKYGKTKVDFNLPDNVCQLKIKEPVSKVSPAKFESSLQKYLPPSSDAYVNVGIVVADKTRLCDYPSYLPVLVNTLTKKGATPNNITFYIAYGTHKRQSDEDSLRCYGETYNHYRFVHHNASDEAALINLGTTQRGTTVSVRKDAIKSSLLITFGAISHHYFAGFGGGRKLIFPGLAGKDAVYHNHALFLDRENKTLSEGCQPGKLNKNPIAEDLKEIDSYLPPKISIHGILNSTGKVADLIVGKNYSDFVEACEEHNNYYSSAKKEQFDLVIASCGGYPKDINFIQAHKSLHHAAAFVKDGGQLIIISKCPDGIASTSFIKYFELGSFEKAFNNLVNKYEGNGGTALSMMVKLQRISISMVTELKEELCSQIGVVKISPQKGQEIINSESGSVAFIGNASMLVRK